MDFAKAQDIEYWRNNPDSILLVARIYAKKWGGWSVDLEDCQMYLAERIVSAIEKFDSALNVSASSYIYRVCRYAVKDYLRKYGSSYKLLGARREIKVDIRTVEYHEEDRDDDPTSRSLQNARFNGAHHDFHHDFDLIQALKKETLQTRKIVFFYYFLEWTIPQIAEELERDQTWIHRKLHQFGRKYYKNHLAPESYRSSSSYQEDIQIEKLEDIYKLVQKQSSLTQDTFSKS